MERLAERITDGDAGVRGALRALLAGAVLPGLGPGPLAPFLLLLMAHVSAGLTHLAAPIRRAPALARACFPQPGQHGALPAAAHGAPVRRHDPPGTPHQARFRAWDSCWGSGAWSASLANDRSSLAWCCLYDAYQTCAVRLVAAANV